jgi:hypothetical protein
VESHYGGEVIAERRRSDSRAKEKRSRSEEVIAEWRSDCAQEKIAKWRREDCGVQK